MSSIKFGLFAVVLGTACGSGEDPCDVSGTACVWAGTGERGFNNLDPDAHRQASKLYFPEDLTFGPDNRAYVVDWNNHRIRRVEKNDSMTVVIGTDYEGDGPPEMEDRLPLCNPAGAVPTEVALNHMTDVEFGPDGKLYVAAWHNNKIRVLDLETNVMTSIAGNGYGFSGDDGAACNALFNQPKAIVFGDDGTLYTIDQRNVRIRTIDTAGTIRTIAGTGTLGNLGDGGVAKDAQFGFETGTTPRPSGALVMNGRELLIADSLNNRIRRINLDNQFVDCIAGKGEQGYGGDGGHALDAKFDFPMDMELGPDGRLYIADRMNHAIRAMDLQTGIIETVVGGNGLCDTTAGDCPVDGLDPRTIQIYEPYGLAFDQTGNLFVADTHNHRIIKVTK